MLSYLECLTGWYRVDDSPHTSAAAAHVLRNRWRQRLSTSVVPCSRVAAVAGKAEDVPVAGMLRTRRLRAGTALPYVCPCIVIDTDSYRKGSNDPTLLVGSESPSAYRIDRHSKRREKTWPGTSLVQAPPNPHGGRPLAGVPS